MTWRFGQVPPESLIGFVEYWQSSFVRAAFSADRAIKLFYGPAYTSACRDLLLSSLPVSGQLLV